MKIAVTLIILSVLFGGSVAYYLRNRSDWWKIWRPKILAFGGAFLLGITVLHLMPEVFNQRGREELPLFILLGFLIQIILETFTGGVEHGHVHKNQQQSSFLWSKAVPVFIGLTLHALLEGMPISGMSHHDHSHPYIWGIFVHKFPAAFALMAYLLGSGLKGFQAWLLLIVFSLTTPLGIWIGHSTVNQTDIDFYYPVFVAIVVGSFLHIATIVLFEFSNPQGHKFSYIRLALILLGLMLAYLI